MGLVTYQGGVLARRWSPIPVLTGLNVVQLRSCDERRYDSAKRPTRASYTYCWRRRWVNRHGTRRRPGQRGPRRSTRSLTASSPSPVCLTGERTHRCATGKLRRFIQRPADTQVMENWPSVITVNLRHTGVFT